MTMVRSTPITNVVQYANSAPKSVVLILTDTAQKGSDFSLIDAVPFILRLKNSVDNPQRAVVIVKLPSDQTDFWANTVGPVITWIQQAYPGLPIDLAAYGKGGNNVPSNLQAYTNVFRSVAVVDPSPNFDNSTATVNAMKSIYSLLGTSGQVGSSVIDPIQNALHAVPVAQNVCSAEWIGLDSTEGQVNAREEFFTGIWGDGTHPNKNIPSYWNWLDTVVDPDVAGLRSKNLYINGSTTPFQNPVPVGTIVTKWEIR